MEERFDCADFRDGPRVDPVVSANVVRRPSHDETARQLEQPLLVQLGKMNRPPVPQRVADGNNQGEFIAAEQFITQVGRMMRQKAQTNIQSTLFQRRLNVIG